jgi:hypothetical protein
LVTILIVIITALHDILVAFNAGDAPRAQLWLLSVITGYFALIVHRLDRSSSLSATASPLPANP